MSIKEITDRLEPMSGVLTDDQLENLGPHIVLSIAISLKRLADIEDLRFAAQCRGELR